MTIDEAVEILKTFHDKAACSLDASSAFAFQLGIEALEKQKALRRKWYHFHTLLEFVTALLPSETEVEK